MYMYLNFDTRHLLKIKIHPKISLIFVEKNFLGKATVIFCSIIPVLSTLQQDERLVRAQLNIQWILVILIMLFRLSNFPVIFEVVKIARNQMGAVPFKRENVPIQASAITLKIANVINKNRTSNIANT